VDKRCTVCGETKPLDAFYRSAGMRDGHRNDCKACNLAAKARRYAANPEQMKARVRQWQRANPERIRAYRRVYRQRAEVKARDRAGHLRRAFGITQQHYEQLLVAQHGGCAVCGRAPRVGKALHVDHDHATGEIRGLLCFSCNSALGNLGEDEKRIRAMLDYLTGGDEQRSR
jgi:Autographiviridae endonuclease VII